MHPCYIRVKIAKQRPTAQTKHLRRCHPSCHLHPNTWRFMMILPYSSTSSTVDGGCGCWWLLVSPSVSLGASGTRRPMLVKGTLWRSKGEDLAHPLGYRNGNLSSWSWLKQSFKANIPSPSASLLVATEVYQLFLTSTFLFLFTATDGLPSKRTRQINKQINKETAFIVYAWLNSNTQSIYCVRPYLI